VVLGGPATAEAARAHNLPSVLIESSRASILQAVFEAVRVARAIENEKYKHELFSAVVDYANDGIITVDMSGVISTINPRAIRITNFKRAIGINIETLWPDLELTRVIANKEQQLGQIMAINGRQVLCNKVPIIVNNRPAGAVANFQEISKIQQLEAAIRRKIYAKGHVARFTFSDIWGKSAAIQKVIRIAKDYAGTESNIFISGATGTGKEVFTQSIHNFSHRENGPFVAVNCAALPGQILESELFGYVKGAFTGANKEGKPGVFELAHGGTIFLDEITELDYVNQGRLLRVLQEKAVVRLGSDTVTPVDVRIIAATNKDLGRAVEEKRFRDDLFYRLNVLKLTIPSLRERKADIRDYAGKFLERYTQAGRQTMMFRPGAFRLLEKFDWPGNIRQLQNTIERVAVLCKEPLISEAMIAQCLDVPDKKAGQHNIVSQEIDEILQALVKAKGRHNEAAKMLGINRSTLWRKMQRLGLS
jgi:transcriptional regulator with PAS, ATPase and Fis domain